MNLLDILLGVLDQPAVQEPAAQAIATYLRAKLPTGVEKDLADFLGLVSKHLLEPPPVA